MDSDLVLEIFIAFRKKPTVRRIVAKGIDRALKEVVHEDKTR